MSKQKALSIKQPWAWLIVNGYKDVENRTWNTKHRGKFYVHASKMKDRKAIERLTAEGIELPEEYDTGGIVGHVDLVDVIMPSKDHDSVWRDDGSYAFILENAEILPFRPYKGQQGFFYIEEENE